MLKLKGLYKIILMKKGNRMEASLVLKGYIKDCVSRFRLEFLFKIV